MTGGEAAMLVVLSVELSLGLPGLGTAGGCRAGLWGRAGGAHWCLKSCHERVHILRSIVQKG